jgi:hypothetical protein
MKGNNREIERQQIEDRIIRAIDEGGVHDPKASEKWPPCVWAQLTVKYLHDSRCRATLGALGIMAGYHV